MNESSTSRLHRAIVIAIVLWICSFFLPTIIFPPNTANHWAPEDGMQLGYAAALLSLTAGVMNAIVLADAIRAGHLSWVVSHFSVDGLLWLANLWMLIAPFRLRSLSRGRSTPLLVTIWLWVVAPFPLCWQSFQRGSDGLRPYTLYAGFYLWWFSLFLLALLCTTMRYRRSMALHTQ